MPTTIETTVFTFDELSDRAKEKARDWARQGQSEFFGDDASGMFDGFVDAANILGIEIGTHPVNLMNGSTRQEPNIYYSGFSSQGDGASFSGRYRYAKGAAKKIKAEWPLETELHKIATELQAIQRKHFYGLYAGITQSGRYSHSHTMSIEFLEGLEGRDVPFEVREEILDLMRDFANWMYRSLEKEYDYQMSDEAIDETIKANEYTFTEDGERF